MIRIIYGEVFLKKNKSCQDKIVMKKRSIEEVCALSSYEKGSLRWSSINNEMVIRFS